MQRPPVSVVLPTGYGSEKLPLEDLSASGMLVVTSSTLPVGSEVEVTLLGPDEIRLDLRGRVLRLDDEEGNGCRMALEFVGAEGEDSFRLLDLVERCHGDGEGRGGPGDESAPADDAPAEQTDPAAGVTLEDATGDGAQEPPTPVEVADSLRSALARERERREALEEEVERLRGELVEGRQAIDRARELEGRVRALRRELLEAREAARERARAPASAPKPWPSGSEVTVSLPEEQPALFGTTAPRAGYAAGRLEEPADVTLGPDSVPTFDDFFDRLERGSRLRTTERFASLQPVSRADILLSDWLREAETLEQMRRMAQNRMGEELLGRALYRFFERGLVRITR